jgi:antitoxin ParD1/3/4
MKTMTFSLPTSLFERIEAAVKAGDYTSKSEVVSDALRIWEERQERRKAEIVRLRAAFEEGLASGPGRQVTAAELIAEFKAKRATKYDG